MTQPRSSSVGGAANIAGENFRTDVAARIAVHILAERPVRDLGPRDAPVKLRLESGSEVDDIEVELEGGGTVWIQAKRRLELSADRQKPLASAFDQFVRQYLRTPAIDPARDRLVLAYESGSRSIAVLWDVIRRFHDDCPTHAQAAPDVQGQASLEILEQIIAAAWVDESGASPDQSQISRLLSLIVFWELREGADSRVEVDPSHLLVHVVEGEVTTLATDALRVFVSTLAKDRRGATAIGLRRTLRNAGVALRDTNGLAQRIELHLSDLEARWASHRPLGGLSADAAWSSALKSNEVFVSPRLQQRGPRSETEFRAETMLEWVLGGRSIAVLGHVGTGKSTLLLWCASMLAIRAATSGGPVPVLLHARALQACRWPEYIERLLPGAERAGSSLTWLLLIDGVDEVGSETWSTLSLLRRQFRNITGIVAVSRPSTSPAPEDGFECLQLVPWSDVDVERFLASWRHRDASAVERVVTQLREQASADLLANPLTATATLLAAREMSVLPKSRAGIVGCIAGLLFRAWRRARANARIEWSDVKPVLLTLAEIVVRGEPLTVDRVRNVFASRGYEAALDLPDELERQLGVLVKIDDRHFEFAHRSIAEHLVGDSVRAVSPEVFANIARAPWSREAIRHAIGINADQRDHALINGQLQSLAAFARSATFDVSALRAVSSAIAAAADLAFAGVELTPQTIEALADTITEILFEEFSTWVGDSLVEHVRRVARAGGALWDAVLSRMVSRLRPSQADPVDWYEGAELSVETWIRVLLHRDAAVRAVAIDRLTPHIERPDVRGVIALTMSDEGRTFDGAPPAMRAGLAWRRLARDPSMAEEIESLRGRLALLGSYEGGAAALALRPDEAPPRELAQALRWLSQFCEVPQFVLDELMSTAEGQRAVLEVWPGWAQRIRLAPDTAHGRRLQSTGRVPPPSSIVRTRIVRACAPRLSNMDRERLEVIGARKAMLVATELIASGCAESILEHHLDDIPPDAQHALGALLLRSSEVRKRVLELWPLPEGRLYPGIALEPLIEAGDAEAAKVYRKFLPHSPYGWGMVSLRPLEGALTHPVVFPAACMLATDVIEKVHNRDDTGRRLSVMSAAVVLQNLASAWCRDSTIVDRVWSLLDADSDHGFAALLIATRHVALGASRMDHLCARTRADLEALVTSTSKPDPNLIFNAEHEIDWIEERGLASKFNDVLRTLGGFVHRLGWCALAVRWPAMSEAERAHASRVVAEHAMEEPTASLPLVYLERFVRAVPGVWCDKLLATINEGGDIEGTIGILALELLPRDLQIHVARELQNSEHSVAELPWRNGGLDDQRIRSADTVRRLLFELGLPEDAPFEMCSGLPRAGRERVGHFTPSPR